MQRFRCLLMATAFLAACDSPTQPSSPPAELFGKVSVTVDGRLWTSSFLRDSTIGIYDQALGRLQITGQEAPSGPWRSLSIRLLAALAPGAYAIGSSDAVAHAQWFQRDPSRARSASRSSLRGFFSVATETDSLFIDEVDLAQRIIRGRFSFVAQEFRGTTRVTVHGRFAGRLIIHGT